MPRMTKADIQKIQKARRDWYVFHLEAREFCKHLPPEALQNYLYVASRVSPPQMTIYGGVSRDWPEENAFRLSAQYGVDVNYVNSWYLTEAGWSEFQALWRALPEPADFVHIPCVQKADLYPLYTGER